ncbi:uncharacterized protein LOC143923042 [Arctopsyche grandis]|uniref:uncharacterized protein LOC143923042 n=1 Tax=Arctopsyche grandis TaxID=121162 RepID=UPI00406D7095
MRFKKEFHHNKDKLPIKLMDDLNTSSNISDTTPYLILTPDNKRNSISSQLSDAESFKLHRMQENKQFSGFGSHMNREQVDENRYVVKHPESDSEQYKNYSNNQAHQKSLDANSFLLSNELLNNNHIPYGITVQQNSSSHPIMGQTVPNGDVFIKIKSELLENNNRFINDIPTITNRPNQKFNSTPKKSIIKSPLETCIIITSHINSEFYNTNDKMNSTLLDDENELQDSHIMSERGTSRYLDDEDILPKNHSHLSKDIAIDKLQKLSTGLKVQTNVMQTTPTNKEPTIYKEKKINNNELVRKHSHGELSTSECIKRSEIYGLTFGIDTTKSYYETLKSKLATGSVKDCASILQSLRLKLIHTLAKERSDLMTSYIENDILNINGEVTLLDQLLPKEIINGWDLILQQILLKFLNTMSSIWKGRDYLTSNTKVVTCLHSYFFEKYKVGTSTDVVSRDMLIAILHKLSTRLSQQAVLLNTGLVEKIFYNVYEGHELMSTYRVRHSLGVLINLCVHDDGRNSLEPVCSEMLNLLISLLKKKDKKIIPYVARLIYVLMANETFHKKAKDINLLKDLEQSINVDNKRLKLQLDVLKSVIDQDHPHQYLNGTEDNFLANIEAEMDELEEEVEVGEPFLSENQSECPNFISSIEESPIKMKNKNLVDNIKKPTKSTKQSEIKKSENILKINRKPQKKIATSQKNNIIQQKPQIVEKPATKKEKSKPTINQNDTIKSNAIKATKTETTKCDKMSIANFHEIVESFDEIPTSYIVLNETSNFGNNDSDLHMTSIPENTNECDSTPLNDKECDKVGENADLNLNNMSFVLLSENESSKSASLDLNLGLSSESSDSADRAVLDVEEENTNVTPEQARDEKPSSTNNYLMVHSSGSPKVSLFIQHGKITAIDYDYCEETKEIQSPIEHGNMFKNNRQSPYKGLLTEGRKSLRAKPTVISKIKRSNTTKNTNNEDTPQEETSSMPNEIQI